MSKIKLIFATNSKLRFDFQVISDQI